MLFKDLSISSSGLICACLVLSASSSSWCLGRAAVSDCGIPWTFLLPFFFLRWAAAYNCGTPWTFLLSFLSFLHSTPLLNLNYKPTKHYRTISNGIGVLERTRMCLQMDRWTDARLIAISRKPVWLGNWPQSLQNIIKMSKGHRSYGMHYKNLPKNSTW